MIICHDTKQMNNYLENTFDDQFTISRSFLQNLPQFESKKHELNDNYLQNLISSKKNEKISLDFQPTTSALSYNSKQSKQQCLNDQNFRGFLIISNELIETQETYYMALKIIKI